MTKLILAVEDQEDNMQILRDLLTSAGYEIVEASDGMEGAEKIAMSSDLAMVICDVNMPRMNGLDMLETLKSEIALRNLPVVMLTTEGQPEAMQEEV